MMQNPRFENISLQNQKISPKETLKSNTWASEFGHEQTLVPRLNWKNNRIVM
jgi:hypothetical protein